MFRAKKETVWKQEQDHKSYLLSAHFQQKKKKEETIKPLKLGSDRWRDRDIDTNRDRDTDRGRYRERQRQTGNQIDAPNVFWVGAVLS